MRALELEAIENAVRELPGWQFTNGKLTRTWSFADFLEAMVFVNSVARHAETAGHHPDIDIRYNRVCLALVTHDASGITERDVDMARKLSSSFPAV